jgi:Glycosyl transferase 4-like domain
VSGICKKSLALTETKKPEARLQHEQVLWPKNSQIADKMNSSQKALLDAYKPPRVRKYPGEALLMTSQEPHLAPLGIAGKRVVAVLYSTYPGDPRPRRAAEALAKEGASVEVICLKETDEEPDRESFNGVDITRVHLKHCRGGKLLYLTQYGSFILISGAIIAWRALRRPYDLVHVHNMPDVLVFSALAPKILGAKINPRPPRPHAGVDGNHLRVEGK